MNYTITEIANIIDASSGQTFVSAMIKAVSVDTRQITSSFTTLFFALPGEMSDGHKYIGKAYNMGVRNFVVSSLQNIEVQEDANYLQVENVLNALQKLATHHRSSFPNLKKIGITGSNGKTIVKEWLYQMLHDKFVIVKSPKSYNSQIGMALSLLMIEDYHEVGIFEAGISQKGEMVNHLEMLQPDIGLITNIGYAHSEGFESDQEKASEKLVLFQSAKSIVYHQDFDVLDSLIQEKYNNKGHVIWSTTNKSGIYVESHIEEDQFRKIALEYDSEKYIIDFHMIDLVSFENVMHCISLMLHLGISPLELEQRVNRVSGLKMRLEMQEGIENSIIINDAYSADLDSFERGIEFLQQQCPKRDRMAIITAFDQSGMTESDVFSEVVKNCKTWGVSELIYISDHSYEVGNQDVKVSFYRTKSDFLNDLHTVDIKDKGILIKGARKYRLEDISKRLTQKSHSAVLSIDLNAIEHNLRRYKSYLKKETGIIAVVKASAYGSGSEEVARLLESNNISYLAVAFADEGIALRLAGVQTPIMILNPDMNSLSEIFKYRLEPEIYSIDQMRRVLDFSTQSDVILPIHIKLDTGMHRLGFQNSDIDKLTDMLIGNNSVTVRTIFSHLASSEDSNDDAYTKRQFELFESYYSQISKVIGYSPKKHILNTGGITRFVDKQYDYVRLGIGLYGIDQNPDVNDQLTKAHRLSASLIQIKYLNKGDSVGYNRKTILDQETKIGIVNIGYADGLMRNLGNRQYAFTINGKPAPILGNVCMDLTIVDLTHIPDPIVGDEVVIFDNENIIENLANSAGTIAYEILSRISSRVKRKFVRE